MSQFDYTCNVVADIADIDGIDEIVNCQLSTVDSVNADSVNIADIANTCDRALYRFYARQIKCTTH